MASASRFGYVDWQQSLKLYSAKKDVLQNEFTQLLAQLADTSVPLSVRMSHILSLPKKVGNPEMQ